MTEELTWKVDDRTIGFFKDETYVPVISFNFRVTSYISGPGTLWRGYGVKILTLEGDNFYVNIEASATESWKKFQDTIRIKTWGTEPMANDFDTSLWGPLFKRISLECRMSGERKNKRPAVNLGIQYLYLEDKETPTMADVELVYPDVVYDGFGKVKDDPIHVFVIDIFTDKGVKFSTKDKLKDGGIKQFLRMMLPPYTSLDPEIRQTQILTITTGFAVSNYNFVVEQCGGCPTQMAASFETSTAKTATVKLDLKIYGDHAHFLDQKSSEASINALKAATSTPLVLDDLESKSMEHRLILSNFNQATKTLLGRDIEKPIGGLIISKNFTDDDVIEEKDDEGRVHITIFDKKLADEFDELCDAEADHVEAMHDRNACRDFLAKMTSHFLKEDGKKTSFQEKHKAARGLMADLKPDYGNRKLKCYSLSLASFLMIEEEVKKENDEDTNRLFVDVYKDRATFVNSVKENCDKTDKVLEKMGKRRFSSKSNVDDAVVYDDYDNNVALNEVMDKVDGQTDVEITNYIKPFTRIGSGQQLVAVAHTKLKHDNPELFQKLKTLKKVESPKVESGINIFTKPKGEEISKKINTESKTSIEFPYKYLSLATKLRVWEMFKDMEAFKPMMRQKPVEEEEDADDEEEPISQSQDFPLTQSTSRDILKSCNLCDCSYSTKTEVEDHMNNKHPKCISCRKMFTDESKIEEHMQKHKSKKCGECECEILEIEMKKHREIHAKMEMFGKGLAKGKVTKTKPKKTSSKTNGWLIFMKENYQDVEEDQQNNLQSGDKINHPDVTKALAAKWAAMSTAQKKVYKDRAQERNEMTEDDDEVKVRDVKRTVDEISLEDQEERVRKRMRRLSDKQDRRIDKFVTYPVCEQKYDDNQSFKIHRLEDHQAKPSFDNIQVASNQARVKTCNICHKLLGSSIDLKNHVETVHGSGDELESEINKNDENIIGHEEDPLNIDHGTITENSDEEAEEAEAESEPEPNVTLDENRSEDKEESE